MIFLNYAGDILFEKRFPIPGDCWVNELYELTFKKSVELFHESLPDIISGKYKLKPQKSFLNNRKTSLHFRKEIEKLKKIDLSWNKEKIEKHIRATFMPGFEPPYTIINNKKVYFGKDK